MKMKYYVFEKSKNAQYYTLGEFLDKQAVLKELEKATEDMEFMVIRGVAFEVEQTKFFSLVKKNE